VTADGGIFSARTGCQARKVYAPHADCAIITLGSFRTARMCRHTMNAPQKKAADTATIYSYRLVKKVAFDPPRLLSYILLLAPLAIYEGTAAAVNLLLLPVCFAVVHGVHAAILFAYIRLKEERQPRGSWRFVPHLPWFGLLPQNYASLRLFRRVHHQMLWIGLAAFSCVYLWLPPALWVQLVYVHLWTLLPRFVLMLSLPQPADGGMLKFGRREAGYYLQ